VKEKENNTNRGKGPDMKYHAPLDPDCPVVVEFEESLFGDPMTSSMGAPVDDIMEGFEQSHRSKCTRCQEYGAANIEVV
jgi:hypothetical protein